MAARDPLANLESTNMESDLDLALDSTPIITWLAQQRRAATLAPAALRRSLIARMIWQVSYQRSPGLIANVAYLLGWRTWGEHPRLTLAADICMLRRALASAGHHLAYHNQLQRRGFYIHNRPSLDPKLEQGIIDAMRLVNRKRIMALRHLTIPERAKIGFQLIATNELAAVCRLQLRYPELSERQVLRLYRMGYLTDI